MAVEYTKRMKDMTTNINNNSIHSNMNIEIYIQMSSKQTSLRVLFEMLPLLRKCKILSGHLRVNGLLRECTQKYSKFHKKIGITNRMTNISCYTLLHVMIIGYICLTVVLNFKRGEFSILNKQIFLG